uniref:TIR domain-containing protein n=1 Tax=Candidatus Kentrum sp. LFY TaxID=2126342 RepID=A0A450WAL4_9GAMM|nr:MAG: TIR domain-containing protein [Candidatus Kentron sp. LFY]
MSNPSAQLSTTSEPANGSESPVDFIMSMSTNLADIVNIPELIMGIISLIIALIGVIFTVKNYRQNQKKEKDGVPQPAYSQTDSPRAKPRAGAVIHTPPPVKEFQRIALLYKRHAEPDETLLRLLEEQLTAAGHSVFIDRHLTIGVEWARQIDREIHQADAVIPLLSEKSAHSEMLLSELEIARQAAREQNGRPRILPLRIRDEGPLPNELSSIVGRLQYSLWHGPKDDTRVVHELLDSLANPSDPNERPVELEMIGGAVPLNARFYVVRPTDRAFQDAVARRDTVVLIKGARQMGKTSLLVRGVHQARESGVRAVLTDFQKLTARELDDLTCFYIALGNMLADQLRIDVYPKDTWEDRRSPNANFEHWLRQEVLEKSDKPLLWAIDEADRLFDRDFGSEVFGLFRAWHNDRALDPDGPWSRLTLAIAYATEAHLFIQDPNQSPFNIGTHITLSDFTRHQTADLNQRHGAPLREGAELLGFYRLLGGQPYLVRRGLNVLVEQRPSLDEFTARAVQDDGPFGDHLRRMLMMLSRDAGLYDIVRGLLQEQPCPDFASFYRLRSAGVVAGESMEESHLRCELYTLYLQKHLL